MNSFLSQLHLNPEHPAAARDLTSRYLMHQTLCRVRPDAGDPTSAERVHAAAQPDDRVLWRQDDSVLLVLSHFEPDWKRLETVDGQYVSSSRVTPFGVQFQAGQGLHFRLDANVAVRRVGKDGKSRRYSVRTTEGQLEWLARQGETHGFRAWADVTGSGTERVPKKGGQRLVLNAVRYEGELDVTDPERFQAMLSQGLGHARAFGYGLMTVAPR